MGFGDGWSSQRLTCIYPPPFKKEKQNRLPKESVPYTQKLSVRLESFSLLRGYHIDIDSSGAFTNNIHETLRFHSLVSPGIGFMRGGEVEPHAHRSINPSPLP